MASSDGDGENSSEDAVEDRGHRRLHLPSSDEEDDDLLPGRFVFWSAERRQRRAFRGSRHRRLPTAVASAVAASGDAVEQVDDDGEQEDEEEEDEEEDQAEGSDSDAVQQAPPLELPDCTPQQPAPPPLQPEPPQQEGLVGSLLEILECPVCYEAMRPPIWQCPRGHLVCKDCEP
ncbi:nucleolin-like, partial [Thrips palmi]|uniref:Nucleolin-like n=1 Tax=Thrips palmi TaxID=161013 RepID=A0A6P8Y999_THRPL